MLALLVPLALVGIVVEDQAALRAAPQDSAARPAVLWRGDWLEVRGERAGYLQVYDHRRERPGYVRPYQVRTYALGEKSAPQLRAVLDFLRDQPGAESLGIGYAALLLRAAPAGGAGPDLAGALDALGTLSDRLARRASAPRPAGPASVALSAQLEVAESYGVRFISYERGGRTQVCYDGEAPRRLLALPREPGPGGEPADERARVRAALALTRPECQEPLLGPTEAQALDEWRLDVLGRADAAKVPPFLGNRLRLRRARVLAELTFQRARRGEARQAAEASEGAVRELALVSRAELMEEDGPLYDEVAVRVGAARWPGEAAVPAANRPGAPRVELAAGKPGETCLRLYEADQAKAAPRLERCTYGLVWRQSLRLLPRGQGVALAVQPLPGWVELWLLRRAPAAESGGAGWRLDLLTPAAADPEAGYVELAGWSPSGDRLLVVREAMVAGALRREFQVLRADSLAVERQARQPERLPGFKAWQAADWRGRTISLR